MKYFNRKGKYSGSYERAYKTYATNLSWQSSSGSMFYRGETVYGEALRCSRRLTYEYYFKGAGNFGGHLDGGDLSYYLRCESFLYTHGYINGRTATALERLLRWNSQAVPPLRERAASDYNDSDADNKVFEDMVDQIMERTTRNTTRIGWGDRWYTMEGKELVIQIDAPAPDIASPIAIERLNEALQNLEV
jgi:hypothetical protein